MIKKVVLITGGFGLLGGRLGKFLSNDYNVILCSRHDKAIPEWARILKTVRTYKINWESEKSLLDACKGVDIIIHASGLNAQECRDDPDKALLVNGTYTKRLVDAAVKLHVNKIVYLSTAHVYSDNLTGFFSEDSPITNNHPYATSHIAGEEAFLLPLKNNMINSIAVRITNVFGRPIDKDANCWMLLINDLCKQAIISKTLVLNSNSKIVRDFLTLSDFCSAIKFLIEDQNASGIVNLGSGKAFTIGQIALKVQKNCVDVLGYAPIIEYRGGTSNLKEVLNFKAEYLKGNGFKLSNNFDKEIEDLIYFCKENFSQ